jgi:NhaP-type Na+/H+ or K+/H+ antiporter
MAGDAANTLELGTATAIAAALIFAFSVVARRLGRWNLTAPIVFLLTGWLLSLTFGGTSENAEPLKALAEATLAIVLFTDAAGVRPRQIGRDAGAVSRLLLIGLPLTIAAGTLLALGIFPDLPLLMALLLASMLAPTDAALGAATVLNKAVPTRVRRLLNVESGLNDGLATPVVLFAIAALAGEEGLAPVTSLASALIEIGLGAAFGAGLGYAAGAALRYSDSRGLSTGHSRAIAVLMLPLLAYTAASAIGGNGFIAAFVAGSFFAAAHKRSDGQSLLLAESIVDPMGYATWLAFGALAVPTLLVHLGWQEFVFALAALTVLRMVPVAISLVGSGLRGQTVGFIGWFGPRGLASVVFALIAVESLRPSPELDDVLATATLTIVLSVILHGLTAGPGARRYAHWVQTTQPAAELAESSEPRGRGPMASLAVPTGPAPVTPAEAD